MTGLFVISICSSPIRSVLDAVFIHKTIKMWRSNGIPIVVFLDDGLGGGASELTAKIHSLKVHSHLIRFGFIVNLAKSQWDPSHVIVWLGCVIDTVRGTNDCTNLLILLISSVNVNLA